MSSVSAASPLGNTSSGDVEKVTFEALSPYESPSDVLRNIVVPARSVTCSWVFALFQVMRMGRRLRAASANAASRLFCTALVARFNRTWLFSFWILQIGRAHV